MWSSTDLPWLDSGDVVVYRGPVLSRLLAGVSRTYSAIMRTYTPITDRVTQKDVDEEKAGGVRRGRGDGGARCVMISPAADQLLGQIALVKSFRVAERGHSSSCSNRASHGHYRNNHAIVKRDSVHLCLRR